MVDGLVAAYGLTWAAAAIHFTAAVEHFGEHPSHAVLFTLLACAQLLWGIALYRSPSRRLLLIGVLMNVGVVAVWVVSRTSGIPIGPSPWRPEPVGLLDAVASADEVAMALLVGLRLRWAPGRASRWLEAVAVCLMLLSSVSITQLGHAH